jgi:hypothetical protein
MRRFSPFFFSILLFSGTVAMSAQTVHSATGRQVSITAGGMASIFQPDFEGNWQPPLYLNPLAQAGPQPLYGVGAYVDMRLRRWVQLEAEARWMRWNQYANIYQDNYLVGPRLPVYHFWKATVYGKVLAGYSKMNFDSGQGDNGKFTDIAFGGGVDIKLTKRISLRAADFEYQYYPFWGNTTLSPYGASVGMSYKIF